MPDNRNQATWTTKGNREIETRQANRSTDMARSLTGADKAALARRNYDRAIAEAERIYAAAMTAAMDNLTQAKATAKATLLAAERNAWQDN